MLSKILLIFAVAIGFGATGCTQAYINKIVRKSVTKYRHQIQQVESDKSILEQVSFTRQAEAAVTATTEINSHDLRSFSERHIGELLALLSLFTIWLACRLYSPRAQIRTEPLDPEGLAMIRILKDTALDLWGKYNARPKVIDLECLAEREVGPI